MEKYKIVFCGELQEGHDMLSVKSRLAALFNVRGVVIDKLFLGTPVLIRTNMEVDAALAFKKEFEKTGARCQMLEVSAKPIPPVVPVVAEFSQNRGEGIQSITQTGTSMSPTPSNFSNTPTSVVNNSREFAFRQAQDEKKKRNTMFISIVIVIVFSTVILINVVKNKDKNKYQSTPQNNSSNTSNRSAPPPSSKPSSSSVGGLLSRNTIVYTDPKNYYTVYLPEGCKVVNKSSGTRSKMIYDYSKDINVSIIASPMNKVWDPQIEMMNKVEAIQKGKAGPISRLRLEGFGLVNFNGLDGYELVLSSGSQLAHAYALVSRNNIAFSISIVTNGKYKRENHDILDKTVLSTLSYK